MVSKKLWLDLHDWGPSPDCTIYTLMFFLFYFYCVFMDSLPICISVYHMSVSIQKRASDSLKLELQLVVSYYIDVKN